MGQMDSRDGIVRYRPVPFITGHAKGMAQKREFSPYGARADCLQALIPIICEWLGRNAGDRKAPEQSHLHSPNQIRLLFNPALFRSHPSEVFLEEIRDTRARN